MKRFAPVLLSLWLGSCSDCSGGLGPSSADSLGTYTFLAKPLSSVCSLPNISSASLDFEGTFSMLHDGGVIFTSSGRTTSATFDGQIAATSYSDPQTFDWDGGSCGSCEVSVARTVTVALLSKSQSAAVNEACPAHPLDGGVPREDAGVTLPARKADGGFDSVRACGELHFQVSATGFCDPVCNGCSLVYSLSGARN